MLDSNIQEKLLKKKTPASNKKSQDIKPEKKIFILYFVGNTSR